MSMMSTEKNSRSIFSDLILIPRFLQSAISPETTSTSTSPLRTSRAARNALEPATMQFAVARQLKLYVPFFGFDFMVLTILRNLSYLQTRCLSIAMSTGSLNMPCRLILRTVRSVTAWHRFSMWSYRMWRILPSSHLPVGMPVPPSGSLEHAVSAYSVCLHMPNTRSKKLTGPYRALYLSENLICNRENSMGPMILNADSADCIWSDCLFFM